MFLESILTKAYSSCVRKFNARVTIMSKSSITSAMIWSFCSESEVTEVYEYKSYFLNITYFQNATSYFQIVTSYFLNVTCYYQNVTGYFQKYKLFSECNMLVLEHNKLSNISFVAFVWSIREYSVHVVVILKRSWHFT